MPIEQTIAPDWQTVAIPTFSAGLDNYLSPENIKEGNLTVAENVNVVKDLIVGDLGYYPYKYKTSTIAGGGAAAGATTLTIGLASAAYQVVIGGKVAIYLDSGLVYITTVATTPAGNQITIPAPGLPSAAAAGNRIDLERYILGTPQKFHKLETPSGANAYFFLTTKTLLNDTSGDAWVPVREGATTTSTATYTLGLTVFPVANTAGFAVGDVIRILASDAHYYMGIITAIAAGAPGNLTCANHPFGPVTALGTEVTRCVTLTGTSGDRVQAVSIPWDDKMAFTNGVDQVKIYDYSTDQVSDLSLANTKAKNVAIYDSSLWLISTIEAGTAYKQRLRWCDKADITNWATRDAGYIDLLDTTKECLAAKILGPYLYIYRKKGIYRANISQRGDRRFDFDEIVTNHGIISSDGVMEVAENQHLLFDDENFYLYDGSFNADPIGRNIRDDIFGLDGNIDTTTYLKSSILYQPELKAAIVAYKTTGDTGPKTAYRYGLEEGAWSKRLFPQDVWALGRGNPTGSVTWSSATGTWDGATYPWESAYVSALADTILLGAGVDPAGGAYVYQRTFSTDAGSSIRYRVQTKNFVEITEVRIDWIDLWIAGSGIVVYYSTDRGVSWQVYGTINGTSDVLKYRLHKQFISDQYMFRIEATDTTFSLLRAQIRITPETERV